MDKLTLYLLESSVILVFLYLIYVVALRKETFFNLSRFFLITILLCSLLFPFISIDLNSSHLMTVSQPVSQLNEIRISYHDVFRELSFDKSNSKVSSGVPPTIETSFAASDRGTILTYIILVLYASGVIFCLSKVIWSLWHIRKMIKKHPKTDIKGVTLVKLPKPVAPFSFMKYFFVSDNMINSPNFNQLLTHEKVHIHQRHTLDLLFAQLCASFFWFNPVIWFLVNSLKTVHEYIADRKIIDQGYSVDEYQTVLLDQLIQNHSLGMVHNFNLFSIKKRLAMMSIPQSGLSGKVKTTLTLVGFLCFSAFIIQCNAAFEELGSQESHSSEAPSSVGSTDVPGEIELDDRIVIVNVGYQSRSAIAEILSNIHEMNPRVVGVNAFFLAPKEDVESDQKLTDALASTQNLVMVGRLKEEAIETSWSNFAKGSEVNFGNLMVMNDTRQVEIFRPNIEVEGQNVNAFAMEMARLYDSASITKYIDNGLTKIDYSGNVGGKDSASNYRFLAIEGSDLIEKNFDHVLEGKIVLLGFLGAYLDQQDVMEDKFITPLNESPQAEEPDMFGVVVHANIISQILDGR